MKKSELEMLANLLRNEYGLSENGKWEITNAYKESDGWHITVKPMKNNEPENDEGAENDRNE